MIISVPAFPSFHFNLLLLLIYSLSFNIGIFNKRTCTLRTKKSACSDCDVCADINGWSLQEVVYGSKNKLRGQRKSRTSSMTKSHHQDRDKTRCCCVQASKCTGRTFPKFRSTTSVTARENPLGKIICINSWRWCVCSSFSTQRHMSLGLMICERRRRMKMWCNWSRFGARLSESGKRNE